MAYRNGNYTAFYVANPFWETNLGANSAHDFCYYNLLRMWKAQDNSFPFIDSHNKNYNVRDDSDWETTLKPRLHERLRNSKNIILFLSSITKNSLALREEIDYGINTCGLPIIAVYPDFSNRWNIVDNNGKFRQQIINLWDNLPIFRDNMYKVPTLHIGMNRKDITMALENTNLMVNTKISAGQYCLQCV
ncbi:MAG: hypothetical protein IKP73_10215 [Bacteroidales bacterium]|nr:hypothetical protein [Bacteroidales bacterium]